MPQKMLTECNQHEIPKENIHSQWSLTFCYENFTTHQQQEHHNFAHIDFSNGIIPSVGI